MSKAAVWPAYRRAQRDAFRLAAIAIRRRLIDTMGGRGDERTEAMRFALEEAMRLMEELESRA